MAASLQPAPLSGRSPVSLLGLVLAVGMGSQLCSTGSCPPKAPCCCRKFSPVWLWELALSYESIWPTFAFICST